jgi:hypothetical protein
VGALIALILFLAGATYMIARIDLQLERYPTERPRM